MPKKYGTVYWITGLSGAGKTTIGTRFYEYIKASKSNVVLLDGDTFRRIFNNTDFTREGRDKAARVNQRLVQELTSQGIDVICCVIGMYNSYREWNRNNFKNYKEIYLKVSIKELIRRDVKGLYQKALKGEVQNVYGIDLEYEEPERPDLIIENEGETNEDKAFKKLIEFYEKNKINEI